ECSVLEPDPFHGDNEAELLACANELDPTSGLFAVIDDVPVQNLKAYRVKALPFTYGPLPADNFLQLAYGSTPDFFGTHFPAGATSLSVEVGYYLLLTPLSVGFHTIRFGGTSDGLGFFGRHHIHYPRSAKETLAKFLVIRGGLVRVGHHGWHRKMLA